MTTLDQRLVADGGVFAEVDTSGHLAASSATHADATNLSNSETAYRYWDTTDVNYFAKQFSIKGKLQVTSGTAGGRFCISVGKSLGDWAGVNEALGCDFIWNTTNAIFTVRERSGGTNYNGSSSVAFTLATDYYYEIARYSALGAKGALVCNLYSDSGYTTLVARGIKVITQTDNNYQHFFDLQSYNYTGGTVVTGYNDSITLSVPADGEVLTSDTNVGAALAIYDNCIVATALASNVTQYNQKDGGVGFYSDNYTLEEALNVTSMASGSTRFGILALSNTPGDTVGTTDDKHFVNVEYNASTNCHLTICERSGGVLYPSASFIAYTYADGPKFPKLWRVTAEGIYGRLHLQLYNEPECTSTYGSEITHDLHENINFRYRSAVMSSSTGGTGTSTFTVGGIRTLVSAPIALAGDAASTATATGNLTTGIALDGDAASTATATGDMSGAAALGGDAAGVSTATGNLTTGIALDGNAASTAAATGDLTTGLLKELSATFIDPVTGEGITLATVSLQIREEVIGRLFDFTTKTLVTSGGTLTDTVTDADAANWPGLYAYPYNPAWFPDGTFIYRFTLLATPPIIAEGEFTIRSGLLRNEDDEYAISAYMSTQHAAAAVAGQKARIVDGAVTGEALDYKMLAYIAGKRSGLVVHPAVPALEQYFRQDGATPAIEFSPDDAAGNGTPVI